MPPKGKKDKKSKQRKLDEQARLQEELQQAEELKRIQEEVEEKRKAEETRILAYEAQVREEQYKELQKYLEDIETLFKKNFQETWEKKRWEDYLYKSKEIDTLDVQVVNGFMSEWEEDKDPDIEKMFLKIQESMKIKEDISSALTMYPYEDIKTPALWNEAIDNLEILMYKKLDFATFKLLKDARQRLDEETQNMEYFVRDEASAVSLCLWANLNRAAPRSGVDMGGYEFRLPTALSARECAARLLHTQFDGLWRRLSQAGNTEILKKEIPINVTDKAEDLPSNMDETNDLNEKNEKTDLQAEAIVAKENDILENKDTENQITAIDIDESTRIENEQEVEILIDREISEIKDFDDIPLGEVTDYSSVLRLKTDDDEARDITSNEIPNFISLDEYIPIGGILHFNLYKIPILTIKKKGIFYIYEENPILEPMNFEAGSLDIEAVEEKPTNILAESSSHLQQNLNENIKDELKDDKPSEENGEKGEEEIEESEEVVEEKNEESDHESSEEPNPSEENLESHEEDKKDKDKMTIKMPIPKEVVVLEDPLPACFSPNRNVFSTEGIYNAQYHAASHQISFMSDQCGVFGLFQKKYINFPFQDWSLTSGEMPKLSLTGQYTSITIEISNEGYRVESINSSPFEEDSPSWLPLEHLNKKLLSIGINIFVDATSENLIKMATKQKKLEYDIYNHMALLSQQCSFTRSKLNSLQPSNEFVLQFSTIEQIPFIGFIKPERAILVKHDESDLLTPVEDSQIFSSNLYHLVLNHTPPFSPDIDNKYACMENVQSLLRKCNILSYS